MHSRIFQVSKQPIKKEDYIGSDYYDYDHWFFHSIADYVSDDCYRNEDIQWLQDCVNGITFGNDDNGEYFIIENKEEYFESAFKKFKELLDSLKDCTIKDFTTEIQEFWIMKNVYEDKFGFYVDIDDELMTFDHFIRVFSEKDKFYIGGTVDYHC